MMTSASIGRQNVASQDKVGQQHILVIGAGIIGLQIACSLLQADFKVTILAQHFPGDESIEYTSPWAGAHWRSYAVDNDLERQAWDWKTWEMWKSLVAGEKEAGKVGETGVAACGCLEYGPTSMSVWFEKKMRQFRECSKEELQDMPSSVGRGFYRETFVVNPERYLQYVFEMVKSLGANVLRAKLVSHGMQAVLEECDSIVYERRSGRKVDAYVNASGLGALHIVPDMAVHPIRGVTVIVEGEYPVVKSVQLGSDPKKRGNSLITYILPRPGTNTTVIGGTKEVNSWKAQASDDEVSIILKRATIYVPELLHDGQFKVKKVQVGLRPGRHGGARVELERVGERLVCHAYGNASCGYQNSAGVSEKVTTLVEEALRKES